jgi:flagellar basal body-associated protein FliL
VEPSEKKPKLAELLTSKDRPSRVGTWIALASSLIALLTLVLLFVVLFKRSMAPKTAVELAVTPDGHSSGIAVELGEFHVFLKPDESPTNGGELRLDLSVIVDTPAAAAALKGRLPDARDRLLPLLSNLGKGDLLDPKSKERLRKVFADRIGGMALPGQVLDVYVTNLMIE